MMIKRLAPHEHSDAVEPTMGASQSGTFCAMRPQFSPFSDIAVAARTHTYRIAVRYYCWFGKIICLTMMMTMMTMTTRTATMINACTVWLAIDDHRSDVNIASYLPSIWKKHTGKKATTIKKRKKNFRVNIGWHSATVKIHTTMMTMTTSNNNSYNRFCMLFDAFRDFLYSKMSN